MQGSVIPDIEQPHRRLHQISWDNGSYKCIILFSYASNQGLLSQNVSLIMSTWPISIRAFCFLFRSFSRWVLLAAVDSLDPIVSKGIDSFLSSFSYYTKSQLVKMQEYGHHETSAYVTIDDCPLFELFCLVVVIYAEFREQDFVLVRRYCSLSL